MPDGSLAFLDDQGRIQLVNMHSLAAHKKVIIVGVPGAFTPTCSLKHLLGFIEKEDA
ncbi:redoxin family protein, partial [Streptomyces fildesensis]|uniref:redoxin family protein n=1 Tax=Streptomyces fildesensis TaxID=375757 RepID=UPI0034D6D637